MGESRLDATARCEPGRGVINEQRDATRRDSWPREPDRPDPAEHDRGRVRAPDRHQAAQVEIPSLSEPTDANPASSSKPLRGPRRPFPPGRGLHGSSRPSPGGSSGCSPSRRIWTRNSGSTPSTWEGPLRGRQRLAATHRCLDGALRLPRPPRRSKRRADPRARQRDRRRCFRLIANRQNSPHRQLPQPEPLTADRATMKLTAQLRHREK